MNINVVNRNTTDLDTLHGEVVDIMQSHGAPLGNPFYNRKDMTLEERVKAFEGWLWNEFSKGGAVSASLKHLCNLLLEGKTINLVCVCTPKPCHGDVIKRCLEWMLSPKAGVGKYYTGVGARATPTHVLQLMEQIAAKCLLDGYILRSGGAIGADSAFEKGVYQQAFPHQSQYQQIFYAKNATQAALDIAAQYHPNWGACDAFAKRLHGRNAFQVLGSDLNAPSEFLICWTSDRCINHAGRTRQTGGTGTAISIASAYGVPVHNLAITECFNNWAAWLKGGE